MPIKDAILGFLDMQDGKPILNAKKDSQVLVAGWTACSVAGSTLRKVIIYIDGTARGEVQEFYSRPDVAAHYGRPEFEMSGWRTIVDLTGIKAGDHVLTAQGIASAGEKGTLPSFRLRILE